jgi:hypothetical protein
VNTDRLNITEEFVLEGHHPKPIGHQQGNRDAALEDVLIGTDISYFLRLGGTIVFVYRRDSGKDLDGWKDTLLFCKV